MLDSDALDRGIKETVSSLLSHSENEESVLLIIYVLSAVRISNNMLMHLIRIA